MLYTHINIYIYFKCVVNQQMKTYIERILKEIFNCVNILYIY